MTQVKAVNPRAHCSASTATFTAEAKVVTAMAISIAAISNISHETDKLCRAPELPGTTAHVGLVANSAIGYRIARQTSWNILLLLCKNRSCPEKKKSSDAIPNGSLSCLTKQKLT
jgi:hypothetical protein